MDHPRAKFGYIICPNFNDEPSTLWALQMIFGGLADDLTGGLELAAMLVAEGVPTLLATSANAARELPDSAALVIAQKTRIGPAEEAVARIAAAAEVLMARGPRQLFFKYCATFDSTDQGNIGPCMDVLMDKTGAPFTACCPTFPEYMRSVYQGHLFVGDRLVSESPKRHDPVTPMRDPDLVRVLQRQTARSVGLVAQTQVRRGAQAIGERVAELQAAGVRYAIADATTHDDLAAIAQASIDWPLMTGNSSIAAHYPRLWRERGWLGDSSASARLPGAAGPGVVIAGSCAEQTLRQLDVFGARHPVLRLDLRLQAQGPSHAERQVAEAIDWARSRMHAGPVAIATSATPEAVSALQAELGVEGSSALADQLLGRVARGLRAAGARRFVVAGGETSGAVLQHLDITRLQVGPFVGPSLPVAMDADSAADPLLLCLKSGKLAGPDAFEQALECMTHMNLARPA